MRIGLDIDNVILDTDKVLIEEFLKEDKNKRNKGIINKDLYLMSGMFDWSKEEIDEFLHLNMENIAKTLKTKENAKEYIDKLLEEHQIYLISNRNSKQYKDAYTTTINNLKENANVLEIDYQEFIYVKASEKGSINFAGYLDRGHWCDNIFAKDDCIFLEDAHGIPFCVGVGAVCKGGSVKTNGVFIVC